jgi:Uncharacterized protein conserved in bacteria (DUF2059)
MPMSTMASQMSDELINELETLSKKSLATHLTVEALQAYVNFLEDPAGRSAMDKTKYFMVDLMPVMQGHMMEAMQEYQPTKGDK